MPSFSSYFRPFMILPMYLKMVVSFYNWVIRVPILKHMTNWFGLLLQLSIKRKSQIFACGYNNLLLIKSIFMSY